MLKRSVVRYRIVVGLVYENFGVARRLNGFCVVSKDGISGDGCIVCQKQLDTRAAVAVNGVVFDKDFADEIGIGVQDDAFTVGDCVVADRRNQLGVIVDEVAAYDDVGARVRVRVRRSRDRDAAIAKSRPVRVVVHNVVQDLYVVSSLCINAAAGLGVDRIVLDRDVVGQWDTAGRIDNYAVPVEARVSGAVPSQRRLQGEISRTANYGETLNDDVGRLYVDGVPTTRLLMTGVCPGAASKVIGALAVPLVVMSSASPKAGAV